MANKKEKDLESRIEELEIELRQKEVELAAYRNEFKKLSYRLEKMTLKMTDELNTAQRLQKILSPTEIPRISGVDVSSKFIPGSQYGGDYLDLFEYADRLKFGVLVTSASGYAMSSLLLTVIFDLTAKIQAKKPISIEQFIKELINECQKNMSAKDSFSLFYGVMDRRTFEMTYCLLGSLDAFHQPHSSTALRRLEPCADRILKETQVTAEPKKIFMESKDRFILLTEGIRNSKNSKNAYWGPEGILEAIYAAPRSGVHDLRNEILFRNEQFTQAEAPERDQTVLVMEVKDRLIKLTVPKQD